MNWPNVIFIDEMPMAARMECFESFQRDLERIRALPVTYVCPKEES